MTDEPHNLPKKGEKKPNKDSRRTLSSARPSSAAGNLQGAPRPSSVTANKKPATGSSTAGGTESGSDTNRKAPDSKKVDPRKNQTGGAQRNGNHRKGQPSAPQGSRLVRERTHSSSPAPPSASESSDALSSLQRVIADLKIASPPNQSSSPATNNSLSASMHAPQAQPSNLPANAPVFQPGASSFPASNLSDSVRHRKAASLGPASLAGNYQSFSPHLGAMMEDAEDGTGVSFEDGEIPEVFYPQQQGHQPRSQSQSFMAPRFAALAAQEQDVLGPTGRPQLAPGFMFGARRRTSSNVPVGPPINEEDVRFQFPQQQYNFPSDEQPQRKPEGDITGIMAEQVCIHRVVCYALLKICVDCTPEPD